MKAEGFVVGDTMAFQGLTRFQTAPKTSKEAIMEAGLDWEVETRPNYLDGGEKSFYEAVIHDDGTVGYREVVVSVLGERVPSDYSVVRKDTGAIVGSHVGSRYTPIQNTQGFSLADALAEENLIRIESAGYFGAGEQVFLIVEVGDPVAILGVDEIQPRMLFYNSHNGESVLRLTLLMRRMICMNIMISGIRNDALSRTFRVTHTANHAHRIEAAQQHMKAIRAEVSGYTDFATALAKTDISADDVTRFLEHLFPSRLPDGAPSTRALNLQTEIRNNFESMGPQGAGFSEFAGTAWSLFNSLTAWSTHTRTVKNIGGRFKSLPEARLHSTLFGDSQGRQTKAWGLMQALLDKGEIPEPPTNIVNAE